MSVCMPSFVPFLGFRFQGAWGRVLNSPNRVTVVPIVVVLRIHRRTIEVQVVRVGGGDPRRRPVVAVRAAIVQRRAVAVASRREEHILVFSVTAYHECTAGRLASEPSRFFSFSCPKTGRVTSEFAFCTALLCPFLAEGLFVCVCYNSDASCRFSPAINSAFSAGVFDSMGYDSTCDSI